MPKTRRVVMPFVPPFRWKRFPTLLLAGLGALVLGHAAQTANPPISIGTVRQLFIDDYLIDHMNGVTLELHPPLSAQTVLQPENPWEGQTLAYPSVFKDGNRYRLYYRASGPPLDAPTTTSPGDQKQMEWSYTALAESPDGVHWTKPKLGLVDFKGSRQNNLVWPTEGNEGKDLIPFLDTNPDASPEERYKALAAITGVALGAVASPDGIHWHAMRKEPVIANLPINPLMDPPNHAFWDEQQRQYVAYLRGWIHDRIRSIRRCTSKDFLNWSAPEYIDMGSDIEHLYTNMCTPYERAPGIYFMFAKRFVPWRKFFNDWPYYGLSEIVLLASRDGMRFHRTFMEPFVRPGLDPQNWHERAMIMAKGILKTSPTEMSLYHFEHYRTKAVRLRRDIVRPDGFASVHAPYQEGEFTTKPIVFKGKTLEINYSTSVAGGIRIEIQDAAGNPIPGYRLEEAEEIFGDEVDRSVTWRIDSQVRMQGQHRYLARAANLSSLADRPIRLRFVMKMADIYSFRFLE